MVRTPYLAPVMSSLVINVGDLSAAEKLALMERLWESMDSGDALAEPPGWHDEILAEREAEWNQRHSVSQDWSEAKQEIRKTAV